MYRKPGASRRAEAGRPAGFLSQAIDSTGWYSRKKQFYQAAASSPWVPLPAELRASPFPHPMSNLRSIGRRPEKAGCVHFFRMQMLPVLEMWPTATFGSAGVTHPLRGCVDPASPHAHRSGVVGITTPGERGRRKERARSRKRPRSTRWRDACNNDARHLQTSSGRPDRGQPVEEVARWLEHGIEPHPVQFGEGGQA